jgi:hypothetical protein
MPKDHLRLDSVTADVARYDLARFSPRTSRTPQGFLKVPAFFTRCGVFEYKRHDGTTIRELRPEDEVFAKESLDTLASAPVVHDHPPEGMITTKNASKYTIGWAEPTIERKDSMVAGVVVVMDGERIDDIGTGKLKEISMGYRCRIDQTSGEHPVFGRYDQVQRRIRYNHVALGPPDWGRAGGDVGLRLDGGAALCTQTADLEKVAKTTETEVTSGNGTRVDGRETPMETETIVINGVEFAIPKAAAQAYRADATRRDAAEAELKSQVEQAQGRFDAAEAELKTTKKKLDEATSPERFDSAVTARLTLLEQARKVLGAEAEITGTDREVMEATLRHDKKDLDLTGKSDDYVAARFDQLIEGFKPEAKPIPKPGAARRDAQAAVVDDGRPNSEAARERMQKANAEAWKQPLATTRA